MKPAMKPLLVVFAFFFLACSKKNSTNTPPNPPPPGGGGGGNFNITGTSPEHVFWGDTITISGTGFSTNKADYSFQYGLGFPNCNGINDFKIVSVAADKIKIKIPVGTSQSNNVKCGPSSLDNIIVAIKGKSDTTDAIKFIGWPRLWGVCTHFGGWAGNYVIPGDSVALNITGATGIYASANSYRTNASLLVNGILHNIGWRNYTACNSSLGGVITLDPEVFGVLKCSTDPDWNNGGRMLPFKVFTPGTDRYDTTSLFVEWLPKQAYYSYTGPGTVSKTAGGFPTWNITGKNMSYKTARFTSTNCNLTPTEVAISHNGTFYNDGSFPIPLAQLYDNCSYTVALISHCNTVRNIGTIKINP